MTRLHDDFRYVKGLCRQLTEGESYNGQVPDWHTNRCFIDLIERKLITAAELDAEIFAPGMTPPARWVRKYRPLSLADAEKVLGHKIAITTN